MKTKKIIYKIAFILLLFTANLQAQGTGFDDDTNDGGTEEPAAPIENWIPVLLIAGIVTAFYFTNKKKTV